MTWVSGFIGYSPVEPVSLPIGGIPAQSIPVFIPAEIDEPGGNLINFFTDLIY
jgi:hypothetical protein